MAEPSPQIRSGTATYVSVTELVASVLTRGDLRPSAPGGPRGRDGTWIHQKLQKNRSGSYRKEVSVSHSVALHNLAPESQPESPTLKLVIQGRIDGVFQELKETVLEEIKTTVERLEILDPDEEGIHLGQLKIYGYLFALQNNQRGRLETLRLDLVYFQWHSKNTRRITRRYSIEELREFFEKVVAHYEAQLKRTLAWQRLRNRSIEALSFPFAFRKGQEQLCESVSAAIRDGTALFAQAPTGIGKTLAILFPSIKALASDLRSRIFYLTARTTAKSNAERALDQMRAKGLRLKSVTLTAKQKICLLQEREAQGVNGNSNDSFHCTARECPYAKGYYDRLQEAIDTIFPEDSYMKEKIVGHCTKHRLCAFEFSLDLSLLADCIIGDYNYLFDPRVNLKRFFGGGRSGRSKRDDSNIFLIDEAHNLPERVREIYSAELHKSQILAARRSSSNHPKVKKCLSSLNRCFLDLGRSLTEMGRAFFAQDAAPESLYEPLWNAREAMEDVSETESAESLPASLLDLLYQFRRFLEIYDFFDDTYVTVIGKKRSNVTVKLLCLDPSRPVRRAIGGGSATVFFSATLSPIHYFRRMLSAQEQDSTVQLDSPFPRENLLVCLAPQISTRLRHRDASYRQVGLYISKLVSLRRGNYLVYFPSYAYLEKVYASFVSMNPEAETLRQEPGMPEAEREEFLMRFGENPSERLVGFAVLGGIFGEGIDLVGERLSGAVIVGVGLPQISFERDLLRQHFGQAPGLEKTLEDEEARGFHFAYTYPGFNRIHQAVGRVIRSESDRGIVLLIGQRFATPLYRDLRPPEWGEVRLVQNPEAFESAGKEFWS